MRSKTAHCLIISLILTVGCLTPVQAVTNAELEALEKQIEQLETEEKKEAEARAKRKVEAEAKRIAEAEAKKQAEEKWKRKAEEERQTELAAKARQAAKRSGIEMLNIPGGRYQMGSNDGADDEKPIHTVSVGAFKLGKYEVTQKQWRIVMGDNSSFKNCDNCPVETVSWNDVQSFISKLNQETGGRFRLPTEAEWEYACRSGGKQEKYCGGNNEASLAWYGSNSGSKTHPVGQKRANGLGLYDMSGNVWEWTQDCWNSSYNGAPSDGRAWTSGNCSLRVDRGGSWYGEARRVRSANRNRIDRPERNDNVGFRLAQDL